MDLQIHRSGREKELSVRVWKKKEYFQVKKSGRAENTKDI